MRHAFVLGLSSLLLSCNGTTGYELVQFYAAGRGFHDAVKGQAYVFTTDAGVVITLTEASLHLGALYLTQSVPQAGGGPQPCVLSQTFEGAFVGEVRADGDIDLLDPGEQQIEAIGDGSTIPAVTGQVWLTHDDSIAAGNLNGPDSMPILTLQGTFQDASGVHSFSAGITIDVTRISGAANSALPGEVQICQQRIVSGVPVSLTLSEAGTLVLEVDAQPIFEGVPFSDLPLASDLSEDPASACLTGVSTERCFTNDATNTSSLVLFSHLRTTSPYRFAWLTSPP